MSVYRAVVATGNCRYNINGRLFNQRLQIRLIIFCLCILFLLNILGDSPEIHQPCKLHKLDPWDKVLTKHMTYLPPNQCSNRSSLLYVDDTGFMQYNTSAIKMYSLTSLQCAYQSIERDGDLAVSFGKTTAFEPPMFIPCRYFRVVCKADARTVYDFVHVNIAWNESETLENNIGDETTDHLSVIYVGFDSISGSEVIRKAPLTYKYLTDVLGAYHFRGNMKVGLNTYPNWIAFLRGSYGEDLLLSHLVNKKFDEEPWIWKTAKKANYVTALINDVPRFAPFSGKFRNPPTDYFNRPYTLAMEVVEPVILNELGKFTGDCYGNSDQFLLEVDYFKRFLTKYKNKRKWAFLWNDEFTHDTPSLEKGDRYTYELLQWMKSRGHLDKAILIFASDHGFRLGGWASTTYVGKIEMNMPALMVYFPKSVKDKYPMLHKRLLQNSDNLVTHYDVFETMKGVMESDFEDDKDLVTSESHKGRKLYKYISSQRSCAEAGIPPNFCACQENSSTIDTSLSFIVSMANKAINKMNDLMIKNNYACVELKLLNITDAQVSYKSQGNDVIYGFKEFYKWVFGNDISGRYRLQFYTLPNVGQYSALFDYHVRSSKDIMEQITVLGDPFRLDRYGNQSHCVADTYLKQFCLCTDITVKIP